MNILLKWLAKCYQALKLIFRTWKVHRLYISLKLNDTIGKLSVKSEDETSYCTLAHWATLKFKWEIILEWKIKTQQLNVIYEQWLNLSSIIAIKNS